MKRAVMGVLAAARDTLVITFVKPVREGRPQPRRWARGLPAIGVGVLVLYGLLGLAAMFGTELRQNSELSLTPSTQTSLPVPAIGLLMSGMIVSFALAHTAALRTSWWLRVTLFLLGAGALFYTVALAWVTAPWAVLVSVGLYVCLLVFTIWRSRRQFAWWEFVVVTALVGLAMLTPGLVGGQLINSTGLAIDGTLTSLGMLSYPALMVAGSAPAQIAVSGAQAAATRPVGRPAFSVLAVVAIGWLATTTVLAARQGSEDLTIEAFGSGAATLLLVGIAVAIWLARAKVRTPASPGEYPGVWDNWLYPVAAAVVGLALIVVPVTALSFLLRQLGLGWLTDIHTVLFDNNPGLLWRAGMGVVLLVVGWRISARGRHAEAAVLAAFSVATILDAVGLLPPLAFLHDRNTQATGLIAAGVALLAGVMLAARRALSRERAAGIVAVVLLAALYPHRNFLADPAGTALVFSAQLLVLLGLTWRILTETDFLEGDTRLFPQPTRVLLYLANSLFAATSLAFVALGRATGTGADSTAWSESGDWLLGEPLFTIGLVTGVWLVVRPAEYGRTTFPAKAPNLSPLQSTMAVPRIAYGAAPIQGESDETQITSVSPRGDTVGTAADKLYEAGDDRRNRL